jgi:succinate dehydrogenase/fumarate reductase iron-sulfur protein
MIKMNEIKRNHDFTVKVYRFDPTVDKKPRYQSYAVPFENGLSVLNILQYISDNIDPSLSFYYSCRIGKCNGCLMTVNGKSARVCTQPAEKQMTIEPLRGFKVIKDLVVDQ